MLCEYSYIPVSGPPEEIEKGMCEIQKDWCPYPVPDVNRCVFLLKRKGGKNEPIQPCIEKGRI